MKKKKNNEELQSRREFFKKAAKGALPILSVMVFGPTMLTSCGGDDDDEHFPTSYSRNDGTLNAPYSPSEAYNLANQLSDGTALDSRNPQYIKGRVNSILRNYNVEDGRATFYLSDLDSTGNTLYADMIWYLWGLSYEYGAQLSIGDEVVISGVIEKEDGVPKVGLGYLYSLNGESSPSSACPDCSAVCAFSCSDKCTTSCTGGCSGGCSSTCTGGCSSTCTGGCSSTCTSGCGSTCTGGCSGGCSSTCTGSCSSGCSGTCKSACTGGCSSGCTGSCRTGCNLTCKSLCINSCSGGCDSSCYSACLYTCRGGCYGTSYRYG